MDLGFRRAPSRVALNKPAPPTYNGSIPAGKTIRVNLAVKKSLRPRLRPASIETQGQATVVASAEIIEIDIQTALIEAQAKAAEENGSNIDPANTEATSETPQVVTRLSTSGGHHWGINVGRYDSRYAAEKVLLKTALAEMSTLDGSLRKVVKGSRGFEANFVGMTQETADLACRRLQARQIACFTIGPS